VLGEVARRVAHALVRRGDVAARGVVVRPEVRAGEAAGGGAVEARQDRVAAGVEDALRRLDHEFDLERAARQARAILEHVEHLDERLDVGLAQDLRQRDHEAVRQVAVGLVEDLGQEDVERAERARRACARCRR
jgi:hypothetical protein